MRLSRFALSMMGPEPVGTSVEQAVRPVFEALQRRLEATPPLHLYRVAALTYDPVLREHCRIPKSA